jgi:hypothetical protein
MRQEAKNRIGIGTVAPNESVADIVKRTATLASDRFVLVAPYGGGRCGGWAHKQAELLRVAHIQGLDRHSRMWRGEYTPSELMELLKAGVLPLEDRRGKGIIVEKGIQQARNRSASMRIADHAVRANRNAAENFIGTLNTAGGRMALKQKITEFFLQMEKENAIVRAPTASRCVLVDVSLLAA